MGRKNYHVTKMYAVKGQNCQNENEHCNFPWTTQDRQKLVLLLKGKYSNFSVTKWNPSIFKDCFAQVFIIQGINIVEILQIPTWNFFFKMLPTLIQHCYTFSMNCQ